MNTWIIDAGNTRLKLRELKGNQILRSIILIWAKVDSAFINSISGKKVFISKVVNNSSLTALLNQFEQVIIVDDEFIEKHYQFTSHYTNPKQLGVDRLIASLGAKFLHPEQDDIIVINAGTATTVEVINKFTHMGGMIISGNQLMLDALASADQLPKLHVTQSKKIGTDSATCMLTGLTFMNQGLVLALLKEYKVTNIVVCGGNAFQFSNLDASICLKPDLIMQTLSKIALKLN